MRVGFVGLGNIGAPCARHLVAEGHEVTVVDLDPDARAELVAAGAAEAPDPVRAGRLGKRSRGR